MAKRGDAARQNVMDTICKAFGEDFVGIQDKKNLCVGTRWRKWRENSICGFYYYAKDTDCGWWR